MQLVNDCVVMYDTMKDKKIGITEVFEKFGVTPDKVIEVQSLIGDSTDNVPGVPGIGVKTAAQLIGEYGDLETLLARAGEIKQEKRRQALIENAEKARISKKLVTLDDKVKLEVPLADLAVHEPEYRKLVAFLKQMEFSALTRRVAEFAGLDSGAIEASKVVTPDTDRPLPPRRRRIARPAADRRRHDGEAAAGRDRAGGAGDAAVARPPRGSKPHARPRSTARAYEIVQNIGRLNDWIARAHKAGVVAINIETIGEDPMQAGLCGLALAVAPNEACYVPLAHRKAGDGDGLFGGGLAPDQMSEEGGARRAQAAARGPGRPEDRAEREIRAAALRGARHRRCGRSRTPC